MKKITKVAIALLAVLAVGLVIANEEGKSAGKTHKMTVEVISVDVENKILVVKDDKGEEHKAPVLSTAQASLKTVKPHEMITVWCQDNEKGEHQGVSKIEPAKPAAAHG